MIKFNWIHLGKELEEIEAITDEAEKDARSMLFDSVIDKIDEYNLHISGYEYVQMRQEIINRGVAFIPYTNPSSVKANWTALFAASVSAEEKKAIRYDRYRWHIFSFEKVTALTRGKARQAFNRCKKGKVLVFSQYNNNVFSIENSDLLKSTDFDSDDDIYIFDTVNKWTYVHTHEAQCGPYFYRV